jgi:hypothetical protein
MKINGYKLTIIYYNIPITYTYSQAMINVCDNNNYTNAITKLPKRNQINTLDDHVYKNKDIHTHDFLQKLSLHRTLLDMDIEQDHLGFQDIINNITINEWLIFIELDFDKAWVALQSFQAKNLFNDNGWYEVYKSILQKRPEYLAHIPFYRSPPEVKYEWELAMYNKQRLTKLQSIDLCKLCKKIKIMSQLSKL